MKKIPDSLLIQSSSIALGTFLIVQIKHRLNVVCFLKWTFSKTLA